MIRPTRKPISLLPFLAAGFPSLDATAAAIRALDGVEGVGAIEIGFPFSDPIADGPVIQEAFGEWAGRERESFEDWAATTVRRPGTQPWQLRVVEREGSVVGASFTILDSQGSGYVHQLAVDRDHRGLGLAQAMALIPGVSRSGGTITAALLLGMTRDAAARFSFLLAIPAVLMSGFYMLLFKREPMTSEQWGMTLTATVVAFVVGYAVIVWFMRLISSKGFGFFVIYRVLLGLAILAGLHFGFIQ